FPSLDCHRRYFTIEFARLEGTHRPTHRLRRERILLCPREVVFGRGSIGKATHGLAVPGTAEPVEEHMIENLPVAHPVTTARLRARVRRVGHQLETAGNGDLDVAGTDLICGHHDGLQGGAAHLVDRYRRSANGYAGAERCLPCGSLPQPGGQHVAHDHFLNVGTVHSRRLEGSFDGSAAQLGSSRRRKGALECTDRGPLSRDNDNIMV